MKALLDRIRTELAKYPGTWVLPDDLDALVEIVGAALAEAFRRRADVARQPPAWRVAELREEGIMTGVDAGSENRIYQNR